MQALVTFKNVEPSEDIKKYITNKLERFEKMIRHPESVRVVFRLEKTKYIVDISLVSKNVNIHATESGTTFNEAIDLVLEKVRSQLIKTKEKIEKRR